MRLLVIRHAIAVDRGTPGIADDDRPLTAEGERRFRAAARGLARACRRPDALLTSPLVRAERTAEIAARAWGKIRPLRARALAGGTFEDMAELLRRYSAEALVAVVGHEPQVSELVARLLDTPQPARLEFKKGGAALLDLPGILGEGGRLLWYMPPRILRRLAD